MLFGNIPNVFHKIHTSQCYILDIENDSDNESVVLSSIYLAFESSVRIGFKILYIRQMSMNMRIRLRINAINHIIRINFHNPRFYLAQTHTHTHTNRRAGQTQRNLLQLLSGTIHRHHIRHHHPAPDAVLFFQFNRTMRANCINGAARICAAARFGRKTIAR